MNPKDVVDLLRERLAPYAYPDSFSFHFDAKAADRQCVVEGGRTVEVRLVPARRTLVVRFAGRHGWISLKVEEATLDRLVETVMSTVEALLVSGDSP